MRHLLVAVVGALACAGAAQADQAIQAVTFEEAVRGAQTRSASASVAIADIRRVDGLLVQARSGSLPTAGLNGGSTWIDQTRGQLMPRDQWWSGNLQATLTLSPSRWYQWAHAGDQLDVARSSAVDVQRSAALAAGRAFLSVVGQRRVVEVSRRAVETARAHFDFARARRQAGVGNALDELRAEQQLATASALLEVALTGMTRAQEALGQAAGADVPLDAASEPPLAMAAAAAAAAETVALQRADVRAAGARAQAADRLAADAWADWLPAVLGTYQFSEQEWHTVTSPGRTWQAQVVLSFPIFEGGLRVGQARERNALADESRAQLDGLLRQARSEVRSGVASLQHAEAAYAESQRAADRAGKALALVTEGYRAGASNSLDVTDAEQRARDAETAAAVAEDAVRQARLDLLAATGRFPEA